MWCVDNFTKYAAAAHWIRDKEGAHRWLVAVKATFEVSGSGLTVLSDEQPEPVLVPIHRGDPASTSLLLDSDLLAERPGTEILLDAHAYAPNGRLARVVEVTLRAGRLEKKLLVYGPRVYRPGPTGLTTSDPQPFSSRAIQYEWAFGGSDLADQDVRKRRIDARNPVGKGVAVDVRQLYDQPAHAIEYPSLDVATAGPAGFGPLDRAWTPRRERAGTYDGRWEQTRKPLLPDDYSPLFAHSAPQDQWLKAPLMGGERILLINMSPQGTLQFELPTINLTFQTMFGTRAIQHTGRLTAIIIVPHLRKFSLVWQSSLQVPLRETDYLDFTYIAEDT